MTRPNPIVKIKRNTNFTPSSLEAGELGVDLGRNLLYIGNSSNQPIPIAAEVSPDATLGGINPSDNKTVTEKAAKSYIDSAGTVAGEQNYTYERLISSRDYFPANSSATRDYIDLSPLIFESTQNMNINLSTFQSGFIQNSYNHMILNVNYSIRISSIDTSGFPNPSVEEGTNLGYWRLIGFRLLNGDPFNYTTEEFYGINITPAAIGGTTTGTGLPTLINGDFIIDLPKWIEGETEWELQMIYQIRSADPNMGLGSGGENDGINLPEIAPISSIRIEMVKLAEYD